MTQDANVLEAQRGQWISEQLDIRQRIELDDRLDFDPYTLNGLTHVGGVDISFPDDSVDRAVACVVVLSYPCLEVVYTDYMETRMDLPYMAGFLAFREVGPLQELLSKLKTTRPDLYPQIVLVDGNGRLHPRTCGLACHLGVVTDIPTIGVGKNFLNIDGEGPLLEMKHVKAECRRTLLAKGDNLKLAGTSGIIYGAAQRTSADAPNPVFVSQGHRVSLDTALRIVLATSRHRIPEPTRRADLDSREYIRQQKKAQSNNKT